MLSNQKNFKIQNSEFSEEKTNRNGIHPIWMDNTIQMKLISRIFANWMEI